MPTQELLEKLRNNIRSMIDNFISPDELRSTLKFVEMRIGHIEERMPAWDNLEKCLLEDGDFKRLVPTKELMSFDEQELSMMLDFQKEILFKLE